VALVVKQDHANSLLGIPFSAVDIAALKRERGHLSLQKGI